MLPENVAVVDHRIEEIAPRGADCGEELDERQIRAHGDRVLDHQIPDAKPFERPPRGQESQLSTRRLQRMLSTRSRLDPPA